jgi:hypothetical protein
VSCFFLSITAAYSSPIVAGFSDASTSHNKAVATSCETTQVDVGPQSQIEHEHVGKTASTQADAPPQTEGATPKIQEQTQLLSVNLNIVPKKKGTGTWYLDSEVVQGRRLVADICR